MLLAAALERRARGRRHNGPKPAPSPQEAYLPMVSRWWDNIASSTAYFVDRKAPSQGSWNHIFNIPRATPGGGSGNQNANSDHTLLFVGMDLRVEPVVL